jgi:integrase/recombinase XerD
MTIDVTATSPDGAGGLRRAAEEYLATRRALGFVLSTQGRLLLDFVAHCERHAVSTVTTDVAVSWAIGTARSRDPLWWARRLMVVRIFTRYLQALDPATQVPPMDVLPHAYRRTTPYLYSSGNWPTWSAPQAGCGPGCAR